MKQISSESGQMLWSTAILSYRWEAILYWQERSLNISLLCRP